MSHKNNKPSVVELMARDPARVHRYAVADAQWRLMYSGIPLTESDRTALFTAVHDSDLSARVEALFAGGTVNPSEGQPALHMALRAAEPSPEVDDQRIRFLDLADDWHRSERITDVLHIGIGGSDLGPRLVADALEPNHPGVCVHWLSTMDGRRFERLIRRLDPDRTAVLVASKSFSTEETLTQARAVRDWLGDRFAGQAWAATARGESARAFGIRPEHVLDFPSWTGGRFSLWSSVGVSAAARVGRAVFEELLAGARAADDAFRSAPDEGRLAVMLALMMHYLRRQLNLPTLGFVSYEPRLALLGDYLQQLIMESLGKGVSLSGLPLEQPSAPLIFGGRGTDLQHSIFQALHQGADHHPLILVGTLSDDDGHPEWQRAQLAHLLAQARAFARGRADGLPHQQLPGNRPVCLLMAERLTPAALGYLLASFEHAVFALSVLWDINPFDQWGVEEGKRLAKDIRARLDKGMPSLETLGDFLGD